MQVFHLKVFDESLTGSGPWYTSSDLDAVLGQVDTVKLAAYATDIGGSGTKTLELKLQTSGDGQHWNDLSTLSQVLTADAAYRMESFGGLQLVRVRIAFTSGTNPSCRLRVTATGRTDGT